MTTGWGFECKPANAGSAESVTIETDHFKIDAGGADAGTHYARPRRMLPEIDDFAGTRFHTTFDFELPGDFYTQLDRGSASNPGAYLRLFTTDNHWGRYRTASKGIVGACDPTKPREQCASGNSDNIDEWRVGFVIEGSTNPRPKLVSTHEKHGDPPEYNDELWVGEPLPAGRRYSVVIDFVASKGQDGEWAVDINEGEQSGSGRRATIPPTVPDYEALITRIGTGIDGAYNQDQHVLTVNLFSLDARAK